MHGLASITSRALFVIAVAATCLAVWVKLASVAGRRLLFIGGQTPSDLFEVAVIALLFVIAIELREGRRSAGGGAG
jgi:hypothetical protein